MGEAPPRPQGTCPVLELAGVTRCFSVQASGSPGPQHSESRAGPSSGEGRCSPQTTKGVPCRLVGQPRAARSRLREIKRLLLALELVEEGRLASFFRFKSGRSHSIQRAALGEE